MMDDERLSTFSPSAFNLMKTVQLGNTSVRVSAVGLGAMHLSLEGRPPEEQAARVVRRALESGVTFIDTSDAYCIDESEKHHNERLLHRILGELEAEDIFVATKGGLMRPEGGGWPKNGDPGHLRRTIRESHRILGNGAPIDLWQHHAPDPDVPVEKSLQPVKEAVEEGLIRFVGLSNYSVEQIKRARGVVDVVSVQNQYSPWHRQPEESGVLQHCEDEGLTFLPYSPLGGSSRAKSFDEYEALTRLAEEKGASPQRLVLAWLMRQSPCVLPIPGATRPESIADSAQAAEVSLSEDEARRIGEAVR